MLISNHGERLTEYGDRNKLQTARDLHAASQKYAKAGLPIHQNAEAVPGSDCLARVLRRISC